MALTEEQVKELKEQLKSQVSHLPEQQKQAALQQIDSMSSAAIETMLKQQQGQTPSGEKPIFRMIVDGEIESVKLGENESALAVLSTKSISKGHAILIPKTPVKIPKEIPQQAFELAKELSEKIMSSLKAKEVKAETETLFGESIINLIPIYDKPLTAKSPKTDVSIEELKKVKSDIEIIRLEKKVEKIKIDKKKHPKKKILKLNRKVP
jgi:hypothetical protein